MMDRINRFGLSMALSFGLVASVALSALPASSSASRNESQAAKTESKKNSSAAQQSAGERKFNQNCSRCHKAPVSFPPSISGTILKHMRVRASLSEQDERDILRFLNP
ncbi:MAG TPA: hypothetical protein VGF82_14725 [Terracidiphilus sp.]|jgi:cytochrome c5